jgi:hypothetical protein
MRAMCCVYDLVSCGSFCLLHFCYKVLATPHYLLFKQALICNCHEHFKRAHTHTHTHVNVSRLQCFSFECCPNSTHAHSRRHARTRKHTQTHTHTPVFAGFCSSFVSDCCSNSIRVVKTSKQASTVPITYSAIVKVGD